MNELTMKTGATPEEATALIETLRGLMDLEDGELYTLRKGMFHRVSRNEDDNGLRRIKIMEAAYDAAAAVAKRLRKRMRGYRPDPALVISAFVQYAARLEEAEDIALDYLQWVFSRSEPDPATDSKSVPDGEGQKAGSPAH
ncbi:MAG: hypothetical protein H6976_16585 [Gammaproteobacteria bacterium]|nr:hypothetical protein [Gammaproteobacteria bacterium]